VNTIDLSTIFFISIPFRSLFAAQHALCDRNIGSLLVIEEHG